MIEAFFFLHPFGNIHLHQTFVGGQKQSNFQYEIEEICFQEN
jgi:hypothetical protein